MRAASRRITARSHCSGLVDPLAADRFLQEERKWLDLFENPANWWDNRSKNNWQNLPDFKHSETGETLWIGSIYCPGWVHSRLNSLSNAGSKARCFGAQQHRDHHLSRFLSSLRSCSDDRDLETGKKLHLEAVENGFVYNVYVVSSLISMYSKCGSLREAQEVFETSSSTSGKSTACWNSLLLGYASSHGQEETALELFGRMIEQRECSPDCRTFVAMFMALGSLAAEEEAKLDCLEKGMDLHEKFLRRKGDEDDGDVIFVENSMVDFYAKCRSLLDSRAVFDRMKQHSVVSWTSLLLGCVGNDEAELGLDLFARLIASGNVALDARVFVAAITAVTSLAAKQELDQRERLLERVRSLHSQATKNFHDSNIFVANALIGMYSSCGSLLDAKAVFDRIKHRDAVSWTSMIIGCSQNNQNDLAMDLYSKMDCSRDARSSLAALMACSNLAAEEEDGVEACGTIVKAKSLERAMEIHRHISSGGFATDDFLACALIDAYSKCGSMADARAVFDRMEAHSLISWNSLLLGYAGNGQPELALDLFARLRELLQFFHPVPDRTLGAVLLACAKLARMDAGRELHRQICRDGLDSDKFLTNSLVDLYSKCGNLTAAQLVFDSAVAGSGWREIWSALIAGYASQGSTGRVIEVFERMRGSGVDPDGVTMLSVLSACNHAGKVAAGKKYFQEMIARFKIKAGREHYHCMVDMLGKANELDAAVAMAETMPFQATGVTWTCILAACHKWGNVETGRYAFERLMEVDEESAAGYVLMANLVVN